MALRHQAESAQKAAQGHILLVVHDFEARSSDELSLTKGDRIELIERDDDFGDGWYLGKHSANGKTGLFPEVYTTSAPKGTASILPVTAVNARPLQKIDVGPQSPTSTSNPTSTTTLNGIRDSSTPLTSSQTTILNLPNTSFDSFEPFAPDQGGLPSVGSTPSVPRSDLRYGANCRSSQILDTISNQRVTAISSVVNACSISGEDSPVMNETLSVIQEHISDMNTPRQSLMTSHGRAINDSGSDYSTHFDHRLSYITGHETDEEEEQAHSREEIMKWSPAQVAEYLNEVGVDPQHCKVFVEQEIPGEVLLGMDQSSLMIKDLDLGPIGRRLRTWQKIRALQEETKGFEQQQQQQQQQQQKQHLHQTRQSKLQPSRTESVRGESGARGSNATSSGLPRIPGLLSRSGSQLQTPPESLSSSRFGSDRTNPDRPQSPYHEVPTPGSPTRPSAASVRQLNHSRRHSSVDFTMDTLSEPHSDGKVSASSPAQAGAAHRKQPSFDRNWTMGDVAQQTGRPASQRAASNVQSEVVGNHKQASSSDQAFGNGTLRSSGYLIASPSEHDRGYMSGGDMENRRPRNVLKKRESAGSHYRAASYTDEQRQRSATAHSRQSRFGSADSIRDVSTPLVTGMMPRASQLYFNREAQKSLPKIKDLKALPLVPASNIMTSPTVTKLEYGSAFGRRSEPPVMGKRITSPPSSLALSLSNLLASDSSSRPRTAGLRAISDAVTGVEKAGLRSPPMTGRSAEGRGSPQLPPSLDDGTSTPSSSKNADAEPTESKRHSSNPSLPNVPVSPASPQIAPPSAATRRKQKKETSAYIRGLEQKTPREQMANCDYSGWMVKKNHKLMTTWKPRLFVLRGRRLSYYYSDQDEQEKGLIDISSHRVLPANSDRITGLHATLTGVSKSPTSPQHAQMPTIAATEAAAQPPAVPPRAGGDNFFIFKLVPPRLGLSKAVNFTKPTVHYFAVDNVVEGRLWMAALMKATIDRDDTAPMTTTYSQQTISLAKAQQMQQLPSALKELDDKRDGPRSSGVAGDQSGLNLQNVDVDGDGEAAGIIGGGAIGGGANGGGGGDDSGVSGMGKQSGEVQKTESLDDASISTSKRSIETGTDEQVVLPG